MEGAFDNETHGVSNPMQELAAFGWKHKGLRPCPKNCGRSVFVMESPSGTRALFNQQGRMHINCRDDEEQVVELPPIPDQEAKLREILEQAKK